DRVPAGRPADRVMFMVRCSDATRVAGTGGWRSRWPRACRGGYPARAGGPWLCRALVLFLFHAVVVPSGLTTRVQPHRWITIWWWNGHRSTQSLTEVWPPSALCVVWWTWQVPAGWVQPPAHWQCRSRRVT